MHIRSLFILFVFTGSILCCNELVDEAISPQIIPAPKNVTLKNGQFILSSKTQISYSEEFKVAAEFLKTFISDGSEITLNTNSGRNTITFVKDTLITNREAYAIHISKDDIIISARTDRGAFYAVQSLRQLMPPEFENSTYKHNKVAIKCVTIKDEPEFAYRGMHLDVGRHMFPVEFIKKYIDALAMLKMNMFHWHLTEDQGWRIEIKKYPKLNEIAAYRNETLVGHYNDQPHQFDGKKYGGYYTQEQIKDIVKHAESRHVTIIPEIEMPGHSQAAIAAYPELGCTGQPVEVATKWGVFEEIYCTKEATFSFLEDILDEVLVLFPSTYIHIGGDEAPKIRWKHCEDCQNRIKMEGLQDEHELQNYFITRIEKYLNSKGRQIIGWDEILEGGLAPNATVMSWRGINGAIEAAKQQHKVVMTPTSYSYFDYYQSENENEPLAIGGFLPLEKVYEFNPIPNELTNEEAEYVLGAQGNIWTEYMPTEDHVEYMAFPRILALSEVVWSPSENKDYEDFVYRLENFNKRLEALDINYANHLYEVEGELIVKNNTLSYKLETRFKDKIIRYTLDGTDPGINSELYVSAISIGKSSTIKAAVFDAESQLGSVFSTDMNYHKAVGKKITLNVQPHEAYSGNGKAGLINGINGSNMRYGDKEWLGFRGDDLEITIDFNEDTKINSIETRFYNGNGQWIYAPQVVEVGFDNEKFETYSIKPSEELLVNLQLSFKTKNVKRIKLIIPNFGIIPKGKQGAGNKAWTFIDEIIVH